MTNELSWKVIMSISDPIDSEILSWADCDELWRLHQLEERFNIVHDVLDHCRAIHIRTEEYDHDLPGLSGVRYTLETCNPDVLRQEIRERIEFLSKPTKISEFPNKNIQSITDVINSLQALASRLERLHAPGGFDGMSKADAKIVRSIAGQINRSTQPSYAVTLLQETIPKLRISSAKTSLHSLCARLIAASGE